MASGSNRKESPAEPFKRALGLCVRSIAGDDEVQVSYAPGKPEIDGKLVQLPEPSRVPSLREVAVIRGWADSLALTAACHDVRLHARLAPKAGPARAVFEAVERARIEALGANRMPGMAANLSARVEDQYGHGRYAEITERADAPLEDALSLIVRERLTGAAPPETAKAMVDLWRPVDRGARRSHAGAHGQGVGEPGDVRAAAARPAQGAGPLRRAVRRRARGRRGRRAGP